MTVPRVLKCCVQDIYDKYFTIFVCYADILLPVYLSLFAGISFISWMSLCFCFRLKLINTDVSVKVGIRTNTFYAVFLQHKLIYTLSSYSFNCKLISNFCLIFIKSAFLISCCRPPFVTIVIFFYCPPIHAILSAKGSIIRFDTKIVHN